MKKNQKYFLIRLTFCDEKNNGFVTIGGAGFETREEQRAEFEKIPAHPDYDSTCFVADLIGADGSDIESEKPVSAEVCERLMGKSIDLLIEEGRAKTCFTIADLRKKHPELAKDYPRLFPAG